MATTNGTVSKAERGAWRRLRDLATNLVTTRTELIRRFLDGPNRDLDVECGYPAKVEVTDIKQMFLREGVAKRVVTLEPSECWKSTPEVYETEEDGETEFETAWKRLIEFPTAIYTKVKRADILSGLGRYGVIVIGIDDLKAGKGEKLSKPAAGLEESTGLIMSEPKEVARRNLLFLKCYDETKVRWEAQDVETDEASPRFGWPKYYLIKMGDPAMPNATREVKVHWSRVIHIADNLLESEMFGTPRCEDVWNRLVDIRKILGGSAEMFYKGGFPGLSFEVSPNIGDGEIDAESMRKEMAAYMDGLQRYIAAVGVKANSLSVQIANPGEHLLAQLQAICIAKGVPLRVFMGSEQGKLAADQDSRNWNERVKDRQNNYLTPGLLLPLAWRLVLLGVLPWPKRSDDYPMGRILVDWPDLNAPTDLDRATVGKTVTEAMETFSRTGGMMGGQREWWVHVMKETEEVADAMDKSTTKALDEEDDDAEALTGGITGGDEETPPARRLKVRRPGSRRNGRVPSR